MCLHLNYTKPNTFNPNIKCVCNVCGLIFYKHRTKGYLCDKEGNKLHKL